MLSGGGCDGEWLGHLMPGHGLPEWLAVYTRNTRFDGACGSLMFGLLFLCVCLANTLSQAPHHLLCISQLLIFLPFQTCLTGILKQSPIVNCDFFFFPFRNLVRIAIDRLGGGGAHL